MRRGRGGEPKCPFCGRLFESPCDIKGELGNIFTGGKCVCGAVYVFDRSGHNLGETYVDGLVFACNGDWETAWTLTPDVDYRVESFYYDRENHQLIEGSKRGGRPMENLLFIALKNREESQSATDKQI